MYSNLTIHFRAFSMSWNFNQKNYIFYLFFSSNMPINKHSNGEHRPEAKIVTKDPQWFSNKQQKTKFHEFFFKISWNWFHGKKSIASASIIKEKNPIDSPNVRTSLYILLHTKSTPPIVVYRQNNFLRVGINFFLFRSEIMKYKVDYIWVYKYIFLNPSDTRLRKYISLKKYQNS